MTIKELKKIIENADNAYYAAEYDKAIDLYKQAMELDPNNKHSQEQIRKAEFYRSVKAIEPEGLMTEALQLFKRSRSFIAVGDLDGAKKLLQQAINIAEKAGVDFTNAKTLLENIHNASRAEELKKKAYDELEKQQWVRAEFDLSLAIDLDPTDHIVQELLPHLRDLLKAQNLVRQLNSRFGNPEDYARIEKEIQNIIERTNDTPLLRNLLQQVFEARSQESTQSTEKGLLKPPIPKIFISYSHVDEKHMKRLASMLRPYEKQNAFEIWHDRGIIEGDEWYQDIQNAINSCEMALLLISIDFLNSRFIHEEELPRLVQRRKEMGLRIVPIIIRDCPWQSIPFLKDLQALPKDGKSVISFKGTNQPDRIWAFIAMRIAELSKEL